MADRDELLVRCHALQPGETLLLSAAELEQALPASERPAEWSALAELLALLALDPELGVSEPAPDGTLTVGRASPPEGERRKAVAA